MKRDTVNFDKAAGWRAIAFGFPGTMLNPQRTDGSRGCRERSKRFDGYSTFFDRAAHDISNVCHRRKPIHFTIRSAALPQRVNAR
jgi:hypothetical protein